MERGLLWLPLLALFIGLAWAGWNEYQKVEAYRHWAEKFEQAKYDIYAVLGVKDDKITWGKPTRQEPIELQTFSLNEVEQIQVLVNDQPIDTLKQPTKGKTQLEFRLKDTEEPIQVPFTDTALATQWAEYLQKKLVNIS